MVELKRKVSKAANADHGTEGFAIQILQDGKEVSRVSLHRDKSFIGRMSQNHIILDHASVSRSHALISKNSGKFFIIDQGSQNGTLINGRVVLQEEFKSGDLISIGPFILKLVPDGAVPGSVHASRPDPTDAGDLTASESNFQARKKQS